MNEENKTIEKSAHTEHGTHSHSHRSSSSRKHSSLRRKTRNLRHFLKKNLSQVLCLTVTVIALVALIWVSLKPDGDAGKVLQNGTSDTVYSEDSLELHVPLFKNELTLVHEAVLAYLDSDLSDKAADVLAPHRQSGVRLDAGLSAALSFQIGTIPEGIRITEIRVDVDENEDFSAPRVFKLTAEKRDLDIQYLKTGTRYFYRITLFLSNGNQTAVTGTFQTAKTPRLLSIDGLVNVRDIGGWTAQGGKKIKQGLLIRGSEPDGEVEKDYNLSEDGLVNALTVLGIRTDMDLRNESENTSNTHAFGANVTHKYYGISMYNGVFEQGEAEKMRVLFSDLAKPENYPVYLHCTYGADRTGTVCYLLEALLGLSEDDLIREYELTALYHEGTDSQSLTPLREELEKFEGETLREKTENYLLSIGVTDEEIASIRTVFLGE